MSKIKGSPINLSCKTKRITWLDSCKGFAIIIVVLGHVLGAYADYSKNNASFVISQWIKILNEWIYVWHMPLFFMLSGIAFYVAYYRSNVLNFKKLYHQMMNIGLVYLIFSIVLNLLKVIFSNFVNNEMTLFDALTYIVFPTTTVMWYLWVLLIYYFAFGLIYRYKKINSKYMFILLAAINILITFVNNYVSIRTGIFRLFQCAIFFYMGIKFTQYGKKINYNVTTTVFAILILCILNLGGGCIYLKMTIS